jgi:hypothetical protein
LAISINLSTGIFSAKAKDNPNNKSVSARIDAASLSQPQ